MSYWSAYWKVFKTNSIILGVVISIIGIFALADKAKEELSR